jgi:hypothetical protein
MNRRGFFGVLAGLVGLGVTKTVEPSVDWSWVKPGWLEPGGGASMAMAPNELRALRGRKAFRQDGWPGGWSSNPNGLRMLRKMEPHVAYVVVGDDCTFYYDNKPVTFIRLNQKDI